MSSPLPYLVRMLLFLVAVAGLAWLLHQDLLRVFMNTPILNGVILAVLVIGIFFVMRQVISLWPEVAWLRRFQHREESAPPLETHSINILAPLGVMLGERRHDLRLSPTATRAVLDGIGTRLDERRELARYLIGLLIFLGLLGTFWGLLETIGAVADAIAKLQVTGSDALQMFATLKQSIEGPLKGMSTAFGASLFGLSGSLVLGFLELQASHAHSRFYNQLEEWLSGITDLAPGGSGTSDYASRQLYAAIHDMHRAVLDLNERVGAIPRMDGGGAPADEAVRELAKGVDSLVRQMRAEQKVVREWVDEQAAQQSEVATVLKELAAGVPRKG